MLTPGLTHNQAYRLHEYLWRLSGLSPAAAVPLYQDADLVAGRILTARASTPLEGAADTIATLRENHRHSASIIGYVVGFAFGVRLGKSFAPPPRPRSKWISDEYRRLTEPNRREVQKVIRLLLKAQSPPPPKSSRPEDSIASAIRWMRTAGRQARAFPGTPPKPAGE